MHVGEISAEVKTRESAERSESHSSLALVTGTGSALDRAGLKSTARRNLSGLYSAIEIDQEQGVSVVSLHPKGWEISAVLES